MSTLAGIEIPDQLDWTDEFRWSAVGQVQTVTLSGALLIEESAQQAGRPMTLAGDIDRAWITRQFVKQLHALAATPALTHALVYRGESFSVVFNRNGSPIDASPIFPFSDPEDADFYRLILRLMQV